MFSAGIFARAFNQLMRMKDAQESFSIMRTYNIMWHKTTLSLGFFVYILAHFTASESHVKRVLNTYIYINVSLKMSRNL